MQYLRLWHEFSNSAGEERDTKVRELAELIWRIYPSAMVQTYRMWRLLGFRFASESGVRDYLNPTDREAPEWEDISSPTTAELNRWVEQGIEDYEPAEFQRRTFEGELVPLDDGIRPTGEISSRSYSSVHSTTFYFLSAGDMDALPFEIRLRDWKPEQDVRVTVFNEADERVYERAFSVRTEAGKWLGFDVPTPEQGRYRMEVFDQVNGFTLRPPEGVPMALRPFRPHGWNRVYFYIPQGLRTLAMYNPPRRTASSTLYDPEGGEIELPGIEHGGQALVTVEVPEGMDGRVWSLRRPGGGPVRLLNAPGFFSVSPDAVLIPKDAR